MDEYGVVGYPIAHSKSPQIHRLFAQQTQQQLNYQAMAVAEQEFAQAIPDFFKQGGKGLNVTVPHKLSAFELAQVLTPRAQAAAAVNTLWQQDGKLHGDNTDGFGLVADIQRLVQSLDLKPLHQSKILILGAGGAVQGVLLPLLQQNPQQLTIANRTVAKAQLLAQQFSSAQLSLHASSYEDLRGSSFDWIINATAASLEGAKLPLPDNLLADNSCCYDMMYSAQTTVFNAWAREQGAINCFDGLGMLVAQAAESFRIWRGVMPSWLEVLEKMRTELRN